MYAHMRAQAEHGHPFHLKMQIEKKKKKKMEIGGFSCKGKNAINSPEMDPPRKASRRQRNFPSAASQTFGAGVGVWVWGRGGVDFGRQGVICAGLPRVCRLAVDCRVDA